MTPAAAREALISLTDLEDGWLDGDAGAATTAVALNRADEVLAAVNDLGAPAPSVFPTESGGVRFFWAETATQLTMDVEPWGDVCVHTAEMMSGVFQYVPLEWGVSLTEQLSVWLT